MRERMSFFPPTWNDFFRSFAIVFIDSSLHSKNKCFLRIVSSILNGELSTIYERAFSTLMKKGKINVAIQCFQQNKVFSNLTKRFIKFNIGFRNDAFVQLCGEHRVVREDRFLESL